MYFDLSACRFMTFTRAIFVRSLELKFCLVSFVTASPAFWDDLHSGITSSLADTHGSHDNAKRHDHPFTLPSDLGHSVRCKRPRKDGPTAVDWANDGAAVGPDPSISTSRSINSDYSCTKLQAGIGSDKDPDSNPCEKFTESCAVPEAWRTAAYIVPASNQPNEAHILDHQEILPQWSDELRALQGFLGLSPDNREPVQSAHPEDEEPDRPQDTFFSHETDLEHIHSKPPVRNSVINKITQHKQDETLFGYPPAGRSSQGSHEDPVVLGKPDSQYKNVLQSTYGSLPIQNPRSHYLVDSQLVTHENGVPILEGKERLLDLDPPKGQTSSGCNTPLASVGKKLLHSYAKQYKEKIESLHIEADNSLKAERIPFRGVRATEVRYRNVSQDLTRVIRVLKSNDTLQAPSRLMNLMRPLLIWLIFNNEAFLYRMQPPTHIKLTAQRELSDWLLSEFFTPRNSLPVIGKVKRENFTYNESAFGPVQRWIIKYLSSDSGGSAAFTTSAAIIGLWYKNIHKGVWRSHFKNDDEFWSALLSASVFARTNEMKRNDLNYTKFTMKPKYIGNFQIYDLRVLKPTLFSPLCKTVLPKTVVGYTDKLEKEVVHQLTQLHDNVKAVPHAKKQYYKALSMVFVEPDPCKDPDSEFDSIRLIDVFDFIVTFQKLKVRLACLLKNLNRYHAAFLLFSIHQRKSVGPDMHSKLLHWIRSVMFNPGDGLPIFGKVKKDLILQDKSKIFTGEVQTYLIEFFTNTSSHFEWNQTALSILGYWYKNECKHIWDTSFKNDFGYWLMMAEAVTWGLVDPRPLKIRSIDK